MDRTEAAPLTSERRYGIFRTGLAAALVLIIVVAAAGIALLFGIRNATILLGILLPLMVLSAVIAHLWLWLLHKRAAKRRERAANEWVSATLARQSQGHVSSSPGSGNPDAWFKGFSQRSSGYTPPPGYHMVESSN
ncbi:uncharacterized protein LOC107048934 [Diachasma alloeum]|uniref:uncharacterized protein LOC107048934 n=1 Tax=Diachasma alloeum TaxID=454923 RepID=UPI0007382D0B|nr:uncharacterized protein LOC107048934 [Diachasma alloeum]XP_015127872.1 uncharacterized protein LOC107048934 [Diachasma alloeum]XP_015127873.1 uncharacterized protein LOC107048934 [Diachasma alloeum]XP_015127874.1 uncharacterized protein LOC107048934 [Diachasma alloeum]